MKSIFITVTFLIISLSAKSQDTTTIKSNESEPMVFVSKMPIFDCRDDVPKLGKGCLTNYLQKYFVYPPSAIAQKTKGKILCSFKVEIDGSVSNIKIVKGIDKECDAALLVVLHSMNDGPKRWTPGGHAGKSIAVPMTIPFYVDAEKMTK